MSYVLHLVVLFEIYAIVALSLNLLIGYAGLLQVAHAAFFGVGAYASAIAATRFGVDLVPSLLLAAFVAGGLSLLVSLPAWRFRSDYFVMVSLAVQVALYSAIYNWVAVTNGPFGLSSIPKPTIAGFVFNTNGGISILYGIIAILLSAVIVLIKLSPVGRSLEAMRDDELAARALGIQTRTLKLQVFFVASAMAGIAGGMYGAYVGFIDPTSFTLDSSILMLSMVIVGGTGNVRGPLVGVAVLLGIPEVLRLLAIPDPIAANLRLLAYGLLLILMMHWRPQGLAGKYRFE